MTPRSLGFVIGLAFAPFLAHAQRSTLTGLILATGTGQPLSDAEIAVLDLQRLALTRADGLFAINDIPSGTYLLRLRRIGYQPDLVRVTLGEGATRVDTFRMHPLAINLPEIEVEGRLPKPSFNLQVDYPIDMKMSTTHPPHSYLPAGAAITDDMEAFVFEAAGKDQHRVLGGRRWWHELSGYVMLGATRTPALVAVQVLDDSPTYLVLYVDGLVQAFTPWRPPHQPTCTPRYRLPAEVHPIHAAGAAGWWLVTAQDAKGLPVAIGLDRSGVRWRVPLADWLSAEDLTTALVAARGSIGTIAAKRWPFPWIAVDSSGSIRATGGLLAGEVRDNTRNLERFNEAEAFPVLPIANGYVQTLVGPSGEPRVNIVYDLLGRAASLQSALGIPLLVAAAPTARRLLGVHLVPSRNRFGHLVEYDY